MDVMIFLPWNNDYISFYFKINFLLEDFVFNKNLIKIFLSYNCVYLILDSN